ncbi:MAG: glucose-1-phosphate cytidylyltransferase [Pseudomonadota bacterium]
MKVVILCGGMGTRLREETEFRPKPMVEIGGKPMVWHIMKIYSHYGFNEFVLCLGYKGEMIKEYFLNFDLLNSDFTIEFGNSYKDIKVHNTRGRDKWKITLVDTGLQTMTGSRLKKIEQFIDTDNFMLTYGDGVADININKLVEFHLSHKKCATVTGVKPLARFGVLSIQGERVTEFSEKSQIKEGYINGGFFVLNRKVFDYINVDDACVFEQEPMERLATDGELMVYCHNGYWHCMDMLRDRDLLEKEWHQENPAWKMWL